MYKAASWEVFVQMGLIAFYLGHWMKIEDHSKKKFRIFIYGFNLN